VLVDRESQASDPLVLGQARESSSPLRVPDRSNAKRSRALLIATVIVTVGFSYIALRDINLSLAWRALRRSDLWWIAASLVPFGLGNVARALRWRSLFAHDRRPPA
jgi:uncharacterized membrane protein YbhN (UPF0104 family)